jgi:hypothetical protein
MLTQKLWLVGPEYIVTSRIKRYDYGWETMVFRGRPDGAITHWDPLPGSEKAKNRHEIAIARYWVYTRHPELLVTT